VRTTSEIPVGLEEPAPHVTNLAGLDETTLGYIAQLQRHPGWLALAAFFEARESSRTRGFEMGPVDPDPVKAQLAQIERREHLRALRNVLATPGAALTYLERKQRERSQVS
jgi:hypothetical protein